MAPPRRRGAGGRAGSGAGGPATPTADAADTGEKSAAPLEVGVDGEPAVGAAPVEAGEHVEFGEREAPLRGFARVVVQGGKARVEPAELLVSEAGALQRRPQYRPDRLERHLLAERAVPGDEAFQSTGDPGAAVGVD